MTSLGKGATSITIITTLTYIIPWILFNGHSILIPMHGDLYNYWTFQNWSWWQCISNSRPVGNLALKIMSGGSFQTLMELLTIVSGVCYAIPVWLLVATNKCLSVQRVFIGSLIYSLIIFGHGSHILATPHDIYAILSLPLLAISCFFLWRFHTLSRRGDLYAALAFMFLCLITKETYALVGLLAVSASILVRNTSRLAKTVEMAISIAMFSGVALTIKLLAGPFISGSGAYKHARIFDICKNLLLYGEAIFSSFLCISSIAIGLIFVFRSYGTRWLVITFSAICILYVATLAPNSMIMDHYFELYVHAFVPLLAVLAAAPWLVEWPVSGISQSTLICKYQRLQTIFVPILIVCCFWDTGTFSKRNWWWLYYHKVNGNILAEIRAISHVVSKSNSLRITGMNQNGAINPFSPLYHPKIIENICGRVPDPVIVESVPQTLLKEGAFSDINPRNI